MNQNKNKYFNVLISPKHNWNSGRWETLLTRARCRLNKNLKHVSLEMWDETIPLKTSQWVEVDISHELEDVEEQCCTQSWLSADCILNQWKSKLLDTTVRDFLRFSWSSNSNPLSGSYLLVATHIKGQGRRKLCLLSIWPLFSLANSSMLPLVVLMPSVEF